MLVAIAVASEEPQKTASPPPRPPSNPTPNDLLITPEIRNGDSVTFKLYAPEAKAVTIWGEWLDFPEARVGTALERGADGVWSTTIAIKRGVYRYFFGFARVRLRPGETKRVSVALDARSFTDYDKNKKNWPAEAGESTSKVGRSSQGEAAGDKGQARERPFGG